MINVAALVREALLAQTSVTSLLPTDDARNGSIYAVADLPDNFDPTLGPGIQLIRSGGIPPTEIPALLVARLQIKVWANKKRYLAASDLYGAVRDALHGANNLSFDEGFLLSALEVTGPQEMTDPETGWACVYAFYSVMARANQ